MLNRCVICGTIKVLTIMILPIHESFLCFQILSSILIFSKRNRKFKPSHSFRSLENQIPRVLNAFLLTFSIFIFVGITSSVRRSGPRGIISLLSKFNFSPYTVSKSLKSDIKACSESRSLVNIVVSSAIWMILYSNPSVMIPFAFSFDLKFIDKISATKIKSRADNGHPCLIPLSNVKLRDKYPLFMVHAVRLEYRSLIQLIKVLPKL